VYFPFSKLMHMGGVFLSPTRNMPNNTRNGALRERVERLEHQAASYEAYENEFREPMHEDGLPWRDPGGGA
jgi:hypothetical protein